MWPCARLDLFQINHHGMSWEGSCFSFIRGFFVCDRERERQMARQQETQAYITEFLEARERWKEQERLKMEEENKKIMEYAHLQNKRQHQQKQQKAEREAILSKTHEVVSIVKYVSNGTYHLLYCVAF